MPVSREDFKSAFQNTGEMLARFQLALKTAKEHLTRLAQVISDWKADQTGDGWGTAASQLSELQQKVGELESLGSDNAMKAYAGLSELEGTIDQAARTAGTARGEALEKRREEFSVALEEAKKLISEMTDHDSSDVISSEIAQAGEKLKGAQEKALLKEFTDAFGLLDGIGTLHTEAIALAGDSEKYKVALSTAESTLSTITEDLIATDKETIQSELINEAKKSATSRDFGTAMTLLSRVADAVRTAKDVVKADAEYKIALAAAEEELKKLDGKDIVSADKGTIQTDLIDAAKTAASSRQYPTAMGHLQKVAGAVSTALDVFNADTAYKLALKTAEEKHATLGDDVVIATDKANIKKDLIGEAKKAAALRQYPAAMGHLSKVAKAVDDAGEIVRLDGEYKVALQAAEVDVGGLNVKLLSKHITQIKADCITPAKGKASTRDYGDAMKLLEKVKPACLVAKGREARYTRALNMAKGRIEGLENDGQYQIVRDDGNFWNSAPMIGVTVELASLKTDKFEEAKKKADLGELSVAITLLEEACHGMGEIWKSFNEVYDFALMWHERNQLINGTYDLYTKLTSAPADLEVDIEDLYFDIVKQSMDDAISGGDYKAQTSLLKTFDPLYPAVDKWTKDHDRFEKGVKSATEALATLTEGNISGYKLKIKTDFLELSKTRASSKDYDTANKLLADANRDCPLVKAYSASLTAAGNELAKLTDDSVAAEKTRITTDYVTGGKSLADSGDYAGGDALLKKVPAAVVEALKLMNSQKDVALERSGAQTGIDDIETDAAGAVKAAQDLLDGLNKAPADTVFSTEIGAIQESITDADNIKTSDAEKAKTDLGAAADECVKLALVIERYKQYDAAKKAADTKLSALTQDLISADKSTIKTNFIDAAVTKASEKKFNEAMTLLDKVAGACDAALKVVADEAAYKLKLAAAKLEVAKLTDAFISTDKSTINTSHISAAETKANARKYAEAEALLAPVAEKCKAALDVAAKNKKYTDRRAKSTTLYNSVNTFLTTEYTSVSHQSELSTAKTNFYDAAASKASTRDFDDAMALLEKFDPEARKIWGDAEGFRYANANYLHSKSEYNRVKILAGVTAFSTELGDAQTHLTAAESLLTKGFREQSLALSLQVEREVKYVETMAGKHVSFTAKLGSANSKHGAVKLKVNALTPKVAALNKKLDDIENDLIKVAETEAAGHDFKHAEDLLAEAETACSALDTLADDCKGYQTDLGNATKKLETLPSPDLDADILRIKTNFIDEAVREAGELDYDGARQLLAEVALLVTEAKKIVTAKEGATQARSDAQTGIDDIETDAAGAVKAAQDLLDGLNKAPADTVFSTEIGAIQEIITDANNIKTSDAEKAKTDLGTAADECVKLALVIARYKQYDVAKKAADTKLSTLTDVFIDTDKSTIETNFIDAAVTKATSKDYTGALALLAKVNAACDTALEIASQNTLYKSTLQTSENLYATFDEADTHIGDEVKKVKSDMITPAKGKASTREFSDAMALLKSADKQLGVLKLKKKILTNADDTDDHVKSDIHTVLDLPDGAKILDELIKTLPDETRRNFIKVAMQERFDMKLELLQKDGSSTDNVTGHAKSLKKLYDLMASVPDSHTRDNESLKKIKRYGGAHTDKDRESSTSYYSSGGKEVVLNCGRAKDDLKQPLENSDLALPDVSGDYEMRQDVPDPQYFDWTTLHEVGHAIDDKKGFMQSKSGDASFGGWRKHGSDVTAIANAVVTRFGCHVDYVIGYLLGKNPMITTISSDLSTQQAWEKKHEDAAAWCDAVRVDKELWENGGASKTLAISNRVYHEAYKGTWVSYDLGARAKGVTGYQFRAPGEWFSELYAAYHSGKLKDSHPSAAWLSTL